MSLSRPLLIGLIASATLNVFLIGGLAGMAYVRLSSPAPAPQPAPQPQTIYVPQPAPAPTPKSEAPSAPVRAGKPAPVRPAPAPVVPPPAESERHPRPPLASAGDALSPESRRALRQVLRAANQKNRPITQQARAERQAALDALNSSNFDPAEVSRRLTTARNLDNQARSNVEAALASYAATLTPQERSVLTEGLARIYAPRRAERPE